MRAVAEVAGALPLMFAGTPEITDIGALLDAVDGILLTGARANVHPTRFGVEPDPKHEPYDEDRDALALALVEACVERGVPMFGICRGLQEMNVAFGGSLHPEIREMPGRMNHRMPRLENGEIHPDPEVVFADRHEVRLAGRRFRAAARLRHDPGQFAARPGHPRARQAHRASRASPRTARSRRSASPTRRPLRSASSGTPNTTRRPIRSTAPCSRPSARRWPRMVARPEAGRRRLQLHATYGTFRLPHDPCMSAAWKLYDPATPVTLRP